MGVMTRPPLKTQKWTSGHGISYGEVNHLISREYVTSFSSGMRRAFYHLRFELLAYPLVSAASTLPAI